MNGSNGSTKTKLLFLGTGTSTGIPTIGCDCATCTSKDDKDSRTRSSVLLSWEHGGETKHVLVDAATDLRQQALRFGVRRVDAVLFTHSHADHVHGIDDLRCFNFIQQSSIPCHGSLETIAVIKNRFDYIFNPKYPREGGGIPKLEMIPVDGDFELFGKKITALPVKHGSADVFGYRIGSLAYITDVNFVPEKTMEKIQGLRNLVVGAVQHKPHSTHFGLQEGVDVIKKSGAQTGYITHMNHDLKHAETSRELPANIRLAYDGLVLETEG